METYRLSECAELWLAIVKIIIFIIIIIFEKKNTKKESENSQVCSSLPDWPIDVLDLSNVSSSAPGWLSLSDWLP